MEGGEHNYGLERFVLSDVVKWYLLNLSRIWEPNGEGIFSHCIGGQCKQSHTFVYDTIHTCKSRHKFTNAHSFMRHAIDNEDERFIHDFFERDIETCSLRSTAGQRWDCPRIAHLIQLLAVRNFYKYMTWLRGVVHNEIRYKSHPVAIYYEKMLDWFESHTRAEKRIEFQNLPEW